VFVTDGGSGLRTALRARFGAKLLQQRGAIHKSRNLQWWLGTVLLACEGRFRRVMGYAELAPVLAMIETEQTEPHPASTKKAA